MSLQTKEGPAGPPGEMGKPGIQVAKTDMQKLNVWKICIFTLLQTWFFRGQLVNLGRKDNQGSRELWYIVKKLNNGSVFMQKDFLIPPNSFTVYKIAFDCSLWPEGKYTLFSCVVKVTFSFNVHHFLTFDQSFNARPVLRLDLHAVLNSKTSDWGFNQDTMEVVEKREWSARILEFGGKP